MSTETWRDRLRSAMKAKGLSMRGLSLAAEMGPGYVFSILSDGKDPTIENLVRLCAVLDVPLYRIVYGDHHPAAQAEEVLELFLQSGAPTRQAILSLLRDRKAS